MNVPEWFLKSVFVWSLFFLYMIFWVWSLAALVKETGKGRDVEILIWVIVLVFVPVIGLTLYALYGPGADPAKEVNAPQKRADT